MTKTENKRNCFANVTDIIDQYDSKRYPEVKHKLYRYIRNTNDRLKIVCYRNRSCVTEQDRQCNFFLIAASKDQGLSCKICKNVCIRHSCMTPGANIMQPSEVLARKEMVYQKNKKRRAEEELEACDEAWTVLNSDKYFKEPAVFARRTEFLESKGVFAASDLKDLDAEHVGEFASLLKEVPCAKLKRLLQKNMKRKKKK